MTRIKTTKLVYTADEILGGNAGDGTGDDDDDFCGHPLVAVTVCAWCANAMGNEHERRDRCIAVLHTLTLWRCAQHEAPARGLLAALAARVYVQRKMCSSACHCLLS